jgi:hypothetical protein
VHDRNLTTRWWSGQAQNGGEWIQLEFDRPTKVSEVRFKIVRRFYSEYPRQLVVESYPADGAARELYRGSVLVQYAQGLIGDGWISFGLPPNESTAIRIRQTVASPFGWSIHEIELRSR